MLLALGIAACGAGTSATSEPTLRTPIPATPQPTLPPDAFTASVLMETGGKHPAGSDLDRLWADVFANVKIQGAAGYTPPDAVLGYRSGDLPDTACAHEQSTTAWIENARHCPKDHRIVYDEDWLRSMASNYGDEAAFTVLAHEWAHYAQSLFGNPLVSINRELQADCLAALYVSTSTLLPHGSVADEDAAMRTAMETMYTLGNTDYKQSEWFAAGEHGSPTQRIMAVSTGLQSNQEILDPTGSMASGLPFCYGYRDYEPGNMKRIGGHGFLELPGRRSSFIDGTYLLEPESRTGQPGSSVIMAALDALPLAGGATMEQVRALWEAGYPGIEPIGDPIDLAGNVAPGTGTAHYYQHVKTAAGGSQSVESGLFSLIAPASGEGGLLILVVRPELAPQDGSGPAGLAVLEEQLITLYEVLSRLCTPDESPDASAPNFDPVCLASLQ